MRLSDLSTGERAVIVKIYGHGGFRKRIVEMGFIKGKPVKVLFNAPLHDPMVYEVIGYKVSLRREEARMIEVISESEVDRENSSAEQLGPIASHEPQIGARHQSPADSRQREMERLAAERIRNIRVAIVGNPNCGKTSLFNVATGSHEHVGNYSGVTVGAKEGRFDHKGYRFAIVDLPGAYSLSAYSPEELYVRKNLVDDTPDIIVNVIDGTNLERNLYLTMQLIDMNIPMVIALNMFDDLQKSGDRFDYESMASMLGTPIVPTVSRSGKGIDTLFDTVIDVYNGVNETALRHIHVNHGEMLERSINRVRGVIAKHAGGLASRYSLRFLAIKKLEGDTDIDGVLAGLENHEEIAAVCYEEKRRIEEELKETGESAITDAMYGFIAGAMRETYLPRNTRANRKTLTERIDAVVTNRYAGYPIFFLIVFLMFYLTFIVGQYPMDWIDSVVGKLADFVGTSMSGGMLRHLVTDGVIGGVGAVVVFLPNILILYFFISLLEDSGYMARAAFIMDRVMHRMGLHGKSFIPMIMGFGCNVPAVMATRTIESPRSRIVTVLVTPLMSCSARIPLYVVLAGAFFPNHAPLILLSLYAFGILAAVAMARVFSRMFRKNANLPFVMELPPYRMPAMRMILRHTWEKGRQYLRKMGGIILVASVLIWALGYFPCGNGASGDTATGGSYLERIGRFVEPATEPMGFDWRMNAGLIAGAGAKELVVSTMGVLYSDGHAMRGAETAVADHGDDATRLQKAVRKTIEPRSAAAYMVFVLLYFPCLATLAAVRNETGRWRWAAFTALYTTTLAYVCSLLTYWLWGLFA